MKSEDLENQIHEWHNSDSVLPVYEYLGWTFEEYMTWVKTNVQPNKNE